MEYKKFGELGRDEKMGLLAAWIDGEVIECFLRERACDESAWYPCHAPRWDSELYYRVAPAPVVKPSINWDHVAERFVALAVDSNGLWYLYEEQPVPDVEIGRFSSNKAYGKADHFASFDPGSFVPKNCSDIENWQNSIVYRPGYEPKGKS